MQLASNADARSGRVLTAPWMEEATGFGSVPKRPVWRAPLWFALSVLSPISSTTQGLAGPALQGITSWCDCYGARLSEGSGGEALVPRSASSKLARVRSNLSLQVAELARILRVERPTVYSWMRDDSVALRAENRDRLDRLEVLAQRWESRSNLPVGALIRAPNDAGESVVSLLEQERLADAQVLLDGLSARADLRPPRRVPSVRDALTRHGLESQLGSSHDEIDRLSR